MAPAFCLLLCLSVSCGCSLADCISTGSGLWPNVPRGLLQWQEGGFFAVAENVPGGPQFSPSCHGLHMLGVPSHLGS